MLDCLLEQLAASLVRLVKGERHSLLDFSQGDGAAAHGRHDRIPGSGLLRARRPEVQRDTKETGYNNEEAEGSEDAKGCHRDHLATIFEVRDSDRYLKP